jgi:hypothetical protein
MGAFPLDQTLPAGTRVAIPLSWNSLTYITTISEQDIITACADTGNFSASSFKFDLSSGMIAYGHSGVLYGTINADDDGADIIQQVSKALNQFHTLAGLNISEIDSITSTNAPSIWDSIGAFFKGAKTAVETDVLVVLLIVLAAIYFISKSKNIHIGV